MKILCIHAHFDDFEFACAGLFLHWKRTSATQGESAEGKILVCTDGAAGHHFRSREETSRIRQEEQAKAAEIGGFEWEILRDHDGNTFREGCIETNRVFLASLWKSIRDYQPDYIVCPPIPKDPRIGVHVDHLQVAEGVRRVAYLINVPHAFSPEFPALTENNTDPEFIETPVILTAFDSYMGADDAHDLEIDISPYMDTIAEMSFCHQSQIAEWLPWVGRHSMQAPQTLAAWKTQLWDRFMERNRSAGIDSAKPREFFTVTAWGIVPDLPKLLQDLPPFDCRSESELLNRLKIWRGESS